MTTVSFLRTPPWRWRDHQQVLSACTVGALDARLNTREQT